MSDDWRLRIDLDETRAALELPAWLEQAEHDLEATFDDRVAVSRDGREVFCYTGTRELAEQVEAFVHKLAGEHGWKLETKLSHWHPVAEEWEDPDAPLPAGSADATEHAELIERERRETAARGYPDFEVRVAVPSHQDAVALAQRLREEGVPSVRRWRYLLVGATDEDAAAALAERLRGEAPTGSTVTVEGTMRAIEAETPLRNQYAIFGGLGG